MATTTALVEFDEELPANSLDTNLRVFQAAEEVFRVVRRLPENDIGVRESDLVQPISDPIFTGTVPDGKSHGARVWLSLM
jgi:hypothetical protein